MAAAVTRCMIFVVLWCCVSADQIDAEARGGRIHKMFREMLNQTNADSLNLPANATSIRENITDTFSCENRTYGYYADVDNECQLFHVCLPSQTPTGRNTTYRFSFICPAETVFNQEVLVCTRPREAIPCEESPNYYDLNMEIGKLTNEDQQEEQKEEKSPDTENITIKSQRRQPVRRKQNLVIEDLINDVIGKVELKSPGAQVMETFEIPENVGMEMAFAPEESSVEFDSQSRLGTERRLRAGRKMWRGMKRYEGDS